MWGELHHRYTCAAYLLVQLRARGLLFHDERIWLPLFPLGVAQLLEFWELDTALDGVEQDDVVAVFFLVEEHAPRGQSRKVSAVVRFCR